jgi:putative membrane protein
MSDAPAAASASGAGDLAARRTGMSFQRTRMSADRTLMSVIRTSLSLIGFGFTIFKFFQELRNDGTLHFDAAPRHFGLTLVVFGLCLLIVGILYHLRFMADLRALREEMKGAGLIHSESTFPVSYTMVVAVLLLLLGTAALLSMTFNIGPFN